MAPRDNVQAVLSRVGKQEWFFQRLLGETLEWPVGADRDVDDLSHGRLKTFARPILNVKFVEGGIWQIQPLAHGQPWGIFALEFKNPEALVARCGMAGVFADGSPGSGRIAAQGCRLTLMETRTPALHLYTRLGAFPLRTPMPSPLTSAKRRAPTTRRASWSTLSAAKCFISTC